jgi:hypothetical protein
MRYAALRTPQRWARPRGSKISASRMQMPRMTLLVAKTSPQGAAECVKGFLDGRDESRSEDRAERRA